MQTRQIDITQLEEKAQPLGMDLPIEQTHEWASYQETINGRTPWGCVELTDDGGQTLALVSFIDFETHGYHYLRSEHGPVWVGEPDPQTEEEGLKAIVEYVRKADRKVVFLRLCVKAELDITRPTLSTIPYNQTVIMDTTGDDEEILSKLKKRGRRDVRKALRESPASYADETEQAYESFAEYYDVMIETAERDGFTPAPQSDYENMIHLLGKDHCRVFAGRVDGKVVTWTIATISGKHAVRYYGASRSDVPNRNFVTDGLIYFEACTLSKQGIETYDMMGIGNDFSPKLKTLNTFKTKFSNEVTDVAPDRDVPIRGTFYSALVTARKALKRG